jgi:hypothetical protein
MSGRCRGKASGLDKTGTGPKSGAVIERPRSDDHFWSSMTIQSGNGKLEPGQENWQGRRHTECLVETRTDSFGVVISVAWLTSPKNEKILLTGASSSIRPSPTLGPFKQAPLCLLTVE